MKESYVKCPVDLLNSMLILIQKAKHTEYSYSDIQNILDSVSKLDVMSLPENEEEK